MKDLFFCFGVDFICKVVNLVCKVDCVCRVSNKGLMFVNL